MFGHMFPLTGGSCGVGEQGSRSGHSFVHVEVVAYSGVWAESVVTSCDDDGSTFLASRFGPGYVEGS